MARRLTSLQKDLNKSIEQLEQAQLVIYGFFTESWGSDPQYLTKAVIVGGVVSGLGAAFCIEFHEKPFISSRTAL